MTAMPTIDTAAFAVELATYADASQTLADMEDQERNGFRPHCAERAYCDAAHDLAAAVYATARYARGDRR